MKDECLICGAALEYLETEVQMECAICHKRENSKTRCVRGHYVCYDCHTAGLDAIVGLCLNETSKSPVEILEKMMAMPFCHMHGPEHHVMVGAALLTAYKNAGGALDLPKALGEMLSRGKRVAISSREIAKSEAACSMIDWNGYRNEALAQNSKLAPLLKENEALLTHAQAALNQAEAALPGIETITNEDMDPKNVMWDGEQPAVIDLECLEYGNPVSSAMQLSLQWAGGTICDLVSGSWKRSSTDIWRLMITVSAHMTKYLAWPIPGSSGWSTTLSVH